VWQALDGFPASRLDATSGLLDIDGAPAGTYTFAYILADQGVCPADSAVTSLTLHPVITVQAEEEYIIDCFDPETTILPTLRPIANYDVEWYDVSAPGTPVATGLSFTAGTGGDYRIQATDPNTGCSADGFVTVISNIADITLNVTADSLDCDVDTRDGTLRIESVSGGEGPYVYSFNGGGFVRDSVYTGLVPNRGYTLVAQDVNGCADTVTYNFFDPADWTLDLTTDGNPIANFGESVRLVVNTTLPTNEIESLTWDPVPPNCESCLEAVVRPDSIVEYQVTIRNQYGCVQSDSLNVLIFIGRLVYTPTAFSPNGDGLNDTFSLLGGQGVDDIESLEIYTRWGELIYQGLGLNPRDINEGWDGQIRGEPAPPGAYLYRAQVRLFDQRLFEFEGIINLVR
jgi:gliding motility-associated-like protein